MKQIVTLKLISELQAIEIAESMVEGIVTEMELDKNCGKYELELKTSNGKVDVEVDALTGDILSKESVVKK